MDKLPTRSLNQGDAAPQGRWRRRASRLLRLPLIAYLTVLLLMMLFERSLIFVPKRYPIGRWQPVALSVEDAWIDTHDAVRIHGWFVEAAQPRAVVLLAHGNSGNVSYCDDLLRHLRDLNVSALAFDYRGYGQSAGKPDEAGVLADARAARRWLAERAGVSEGDIVLFGESLGGGVQVDLAAHDGARGLILLSTFSSLVDVAAEHYRWPPVRQFMRTRMDSAGKIGKYLAPLLQIHGTDDQVIPLDLAKRLFAAANEPKRLVIVPGGDHNDPPSPAMWAAVEEFLSALPPMGKSAQRNETAEP